MKEQIKTASPSLPLPSNQTTVSEGQTKENNDPSNSEKRELLPKRERGTIPWMGAATAEPWHQPVDGKTLLAALAALLTRFVLLPRWAADTLALWILHTYAFELRDVTTYLGIESPEKRCGKTTLLTVLSELVNRPVVAANISPPAFFRLIEESRPTLMIDEADTYLHGNDELRGILNAGYSKKTAYVVRVAAGQGVESGELSVERPSADAKAQSSRLARFSCWCPKVLACIGRLPDTLADRCIVIRMQRKRADEECERLKKLDASTLRRQCARFVSDHWAAIMAAQPEMPAELNDRAADIWEPLVALADLAGGDWPERARQAAIGLSASAQENNPIGSLLMDIWFLFTKNQADRMFTRRLLEGLNYMGNRPWADLVRVRTANAPQGVTDMWLAQRLRPYGVRPTTMRIGEDLGKGYLLRDFEEVFRRYIPRSEVEALKEELVLGRAARAETAQRKADRSTTDGRG